MTISMENYYFSSDTGQDKTEWQLVWRVPISALTMNKIKLNDNQYGELAYQFWHCIDKVRMNGNGYGQLQHVLTLDTVKMNDNQYGELQHVLTLDKIKLNYNNYQYGELPYFLTLDKIKLNVNQYGELLFQFWHWTR